VFLHRIGLAVWPVMPSFLHWLGLVIWPVGLLLEAVILCRMLYSRSFKSYPTFYLYVLSVFLVSGVLYLLYWIPGDHHAVYTKWYWPTQLLTLVIGYGVILEFAHSSLSSYPGADRFVRTLGFAIFFFIFALVGVHFFANQTWSLNALYSDLEKYLRVVEALFLAATLLVLSYYRINIGRNLTGIVVGLGSYVAASITLLALVKYVGPNFYALWETLQSASYLIALAVWTRALWSYAPMPSPIIFASSGNYDQLAGQTRAELESLRDYFGGGARL
jgi:hypothetical protein